MKTSELIIGVIVFLILYIIYQVIILINQYSKMKQNSSNEAMRLFFTMNPFRNLIYVLFLKNRIDNEKE